jgi:hypothetical protein
MPRLQRHRLSSGDSATNKTGAQNLSSAVQGMRGQGAGCCAAPLKMLESESMTGNQSRLLKVRHRVCWKKSETDLGTVTGTGWGGVVIEWDDGHTASIQHNDMAQVERAPVKV